MLRATPLDARAWDRSCTQHACMSKGSTGHCTEQHCPRGTALTKDDKIHGPAWLTPQILKSPSTKFLPMKNHQGTAASPHSTAVPQQQALVPLAADISREHSEAQQCAPTPEL